MMGDGFEVATEIELGDGTQVREDKVVLPVTSNVLLKVQKASQRTNEKSGITSINVQVQMPEGIELPEKAADGSFTGGMVRKFVNKVDFVEFPVAADPAKRTEEKWTKATRPYLVPWKQFMVAVGESISPFPKINDEFLQSLTGREVRCDIKQREVRIQVEGTWKGTGEYKHEFKSFRKA